MKIKRFTGSDMRDAMRQVRQALGADAVILETGRNHDGVEISAAVDFDPADYERSRTARETEAGVDAAGTSTESAAVAEYGTVAGPAAREAGGRETAHDNGRMEVMEAEVKSIRCLLEAQLARLVWDEHARRSPKTASIMRNLSGLGLTPDIVNRLVAELDSIEELGNTWTTPLQALAQTLPVCDEDLVSDGGIFAIVGPTGVGKTTTIAKLAARAALRGGPDGIALVTTDSYRIGAREQLETFGQIIGAPVHRADSPERLAETLSGLSDKRLVLIDTAGMSQRDTRLRRELATLSESGAGVKVLLALPANVQSEALQEIVDAFRTAGPEACILTKTDEAASLGGAFSTLIRSDLPLAYVANGQRVPEDLHFARSRQAWLVKAALELMSSTDDPVSPDDMADQFAEVLVNECA